MLDRLILEPFFEGIHDYCIIKLSDDFPQYKTYSDIDIVCLDKELTKDHIEKIGEQFKNYKIKISTGQSNNLHVDFFYKNEDKLDFRFDLYDHLSFKKVGDDLLGLMFDTKIIYKGVYIPCEDVDLAIRFMEYKDYIDHRPEKIKHLKYIESKSNTEYIKILKEFTSYEN